MIPGGSVPTGVYPDTLQSYGPSQGPAPRAGCPDFQWRTVARPPRGPLRWPDRPLARYDLLRRSPVRSAKSPAWRGEGWPFSLRPGCWPRGRIQRGEPVRSGPDRCHGTELVITGVPSAMGSARPYPKLSPILEACRITSQAIWLMASSSGSEVAGRRMIGTAGRESKVESQAANF